MYYNYRYVAEVLLKAGADPNIRDAEGYTVLDYSMAWNLRRITRVLKKYGAVSSGLDVEVDTDY